MTDAAPMEPHSGTETDVRFALPGKLMVAGEYSVLRPGGLALAFAEVGASSFPGRDVGAGGWSYELRVTDQAATGAGAASETIRTYLCSAPLHDRSLLLRDEADDDDFILEPALAAILAPLLTEPGK